MENRRWVRWDRFMRASHLYTGLLLVPWMTVYAVSAFCLNHSAWFTEYFKVAPKWEVVREGDFAPDAASPQTPEDQAKAILEHLELDGPYRILGTPDAAQLTVLRPSVAGHYRITWHRQRSHLVVERYLPLSFYSLVNALHFQHGYGQPHFAHLAWAIIVDAVTISTVLWIVSGVWLWARRPRRRLLGGLCLVGGGALFAGLAILSCR